MKVPPAVSVSLLALAALLASCDVPDSAQTTQTTTVQTQPQTRPQSAPTSARDAQSGLKWVTLSELPPEGQKVYGLIAKGGPFRYSKDGATFGNREGILPRKNRGYYREYTVKTPGEGDRGARRIVCGGQPVTSTADCYYTADHYASFRRIRP